VQSRGNLHDYASSNTGFDVESNFRGRLDLASDNVTDNQEKSDTASYLPTTPERARRGLLGRTFARKKEPPTA